MIDRTTREKELKKLRFAMNAARKRMMLPGSSLLKVVAEDLENRQLEYYTLTAELDQIADRFVESGCTCPSEWMQKEFKKLLKAYIPAPCHREYLYIIDELNQFTYSSGWYRRSVRTKSYEPQIPKVFSILMGYFMLGYFGCTLEDYLLDRIPQNLLQMKREQVHFLRIPELEHLIAAAIDCGNEKVAEAVRDIFLSENNTAIVTTELIRGVLKSKNAELHRLLADFLLAARLQEGVRQAICENMDCGREEAFLLLLDVIVEKDLLRFSSVKRAIATWIGICDESSMDRISAKLLETMSRCLTDEGYCRACLESNDSIALTCALWARGFRDVETAAAAMEEILHHGARNQQLTISYYNQSLAAVNWKGLSETVAKQAVLAHPGDLELAAAFFPTYLSENLYSFFRKSMPGTEHMGKKRIIPIPVTEFYENEAEARAHYACLWELYEQMPKKKLEFSPCIFPWYGTVITKSDIAQRILMTAYVLREEQDRGRLCSLLPELATGRADFLELLLHDAGTEEEVTWLLEALHDRESYTRERAFTLLKGLPLAPVHYEMLAGMLKYKGNDIRAHVLQLLGQQEEEPLLETISRLLADGKEDFVTGGLDLALQLSRQEQKKECFEKARLLVRALENPTPKEKLLIDEIQKDKAAVITEEGYGLYNPKETISIQRAAIEKELVEEALLAERRVLHGLLQKLEKVITENGSRSYKPVYGEECLLAAGVQRIRYGAEVSLADLPFPELWQQYYEQEIHDRRLLFQLNLLVSGYGYLGSALEGTGRRMRQVLGHVLGENIEGQYRYLSSMQTILLTLHGQYRDRAWEFQVAKGLYRKLIDEVKQEDLQAQGFFNSKMMTALNGLNQWENDREFTEYFMLKQELAALCGTVSEGDYGFGSRRNQSMSILYYVKAFQLGLISREMIFKALVEYEGARDACLLLSMGLREKHTLYEQHQLRQLGLGEISADHPLLLEAASCYRQLLDTVLSVELKRGDTPTIFSGLVPFLDPVYGADCLVQLLIALGKEPLRVTYDNWEGKRNCLCRLLAACVPVKEDTKEHFAALLKDSGITEQRLVETAMYAPQWMELIGEYLGWEGFQSGCYYFMAHMRDQFDDRRAAMIAKYTPISAEDLQRGAFDRDWFLEAHEQLGEERFQVLYDSAKYIADGNKHARARKYADAVSGRLKASEVRAAVEEKRNKDSLMSYALIPLAGEADLQERYEYLQQFLKESRQFGAQRRASEGEAVEMAMENLARNAGYESVTRLTLHVETGLAKTYSSYFSWRPVEDVEVCVQASLDGQPEIRCRKGEKSLKSIPGRLKKHPYVEELREIHKKFKEQYQRTRQLLEQSMEERTGFYFQELLELLENPVVRPLVEKVFFICSGGIGRFQEGVLTGISGEQIPAGQEELLRVAHAFDFYQAGSWHQYQEYVFCQGLRQPFKQVFRELYVKTEEELLRTDTRRFSGNQIQPLKAKGCLKNRHWIADYEDGLQKVYYKENLVASIYAMADWFSPSDVEAPTLEWVQFTDRKTFQPVRIQDVPDIVFSEVMRDVDLAVSVAHAGGVDPETSHSTMEMRRAILEFNLPLFHLDNVTFAGNHAVIRGTRATYLLHLGSGIIHQEGGPQLHILPVHSQARGKLFLPFVDEDPKTAEIMSKLVLLAEDQKIKDPYILSQII